MIKTESKVASGHRGGLFRKHLIGIARESSLKFVRLFLQRDLFIGSPGQKTADVLFRKAIQSELLILNRVHEFVKEQRR